MRDVPKKQFPKGPSRFNTVVFSKDDLQDLKNVQSPGAHVAVLRAFESCCMHAAVMQRSFLSITCMSLYSYQLNGGKMS